MEGPPRSWDMGSGPLRLTCLFLCSFSSLLLPTLKRLASSSSHFHWAASLSFRLPLEGVMAGLGQSQSVCGEGACRLAEYGGRIRSWAGKPGGVARRGPLLRSSEAGAPIAPGCTLQAPRGSLSPLPLHHSVPLTTTPAPKASPG